MATKHYLCDYDIEKKGKVIHSGQVQFSRVNAPEDEDVDEAFAAAQQEYGNFKLKRETFTQAMAVGKVPTDAEGNIVGRPPIVLGPQ